MRYGDPYEEPALVEALGFHFAYALYENRVELSGSVVRIISTIEGESDSDNDWHWMVELSSGRFAYITGNCEYSGWDRGRCEAFEEPTLELAFRQVPEAYHDELLLKGNYSKEEAGGAWGDDDVSALAAVSEVLEMRVSNLMPLRPYDGSLCDSACIKCGHVHCLSGSPLPLAGEAAPERCPCPYPHGVQAAGTIRSS